VRQRRIAGALSWKRPSRAALELGNRRPLEIARESFSDWNFEAR
jgi:hypothetical protein